MWARGAGGRTRKGSWCTRAAQKSVLFLIGKPLQTSQIRLYKGWIKNKALGNNSDQQICDFTESPGQWKRAVDIVKISNFGGESICLVALTRKGRRQTFERHE